MRHPRLTVAFDAKRLVRNRTGLGNYSRYAIEAIKEFAPDIVCLLSTASTGTPELYEYLLGKQVSLVKGQQDRLPLYDARWRNRLSRQPILAQGAKLFHGLSNELPSTIASWGIPSVVTMHDLIYDIYPHFYPRLDALLYHIKYKRSCRQATRIVAVSECTRRDIVTRYGIAEEKIEVIYQGCAEQFMRPVSPAQLAQVRQELLLPDHYLLSVGSIEERKNTGLIVEALPRLTDQEIPLLLVGRHTPYTDKILQRAKALHVAHRVRVLGSVASAQLPVLYHGAELFIYPSLYEGFGIPILEALNCGVPVIGATGSCLEEAGGPHSLYCNPHDAHSLATLINQVLTHEELRRTMVTEGKLWAQRFAPSTMATQLETLYHRLTDTV